MVGNRDSVSKPLIRRGVAAFFDPPERLLGLLLAEGVGDGGDALAEEAACESVGGRGGSGLGGAEGRIGGGGGHGCRRRRRTPASFGGDDF